MFRRYSAFFAALALLAAIPAQSKGHKSVSSRELKITVVDVEGGAATLFLTPEGKSLLIDTGWPPGMGGPQPTPGEPPPPPASSSADRIAAAAAAMGITRIDYLEMTHYHVDHVGGLQSLLKKLPVDTFIDHGPNQQELPPNANARERATSPATLYPGWVAAYQGHHHITVHAGQTLKIGSLHLQFVASAGKVINMPLPGAGELNPLCTHVAQKARTGGEENVRSLGTLITFSKTRILDLGDLTWNKELELLCPVNKIGKVDVYFVTGHGMDLSSSPPTAAFDPLVALMQNGPRKGGDPDVVRTVDQFPALEGFWRLHANAQYPEMDGDPHYIANLNGEPDHAYPLRLVITWDGKITVTNPRNGMSRTYQARATEAGY